MVLVVVVATVAATACRVLGSPATRHATSDAIARVTGQDAPRGDGRMPVPTTVSDLDDVGIARLDPALRDALARASDAAAAEGLRLEVTSGWRAVGYQRQLFAEAVVTYGSAEEAARWVAPPDASAHVTGDAVDVGPSDAIAWLSEHGAGFDLCQAYDNEPWHYELRPGAADHGCPARVGDASMRG